MSNDSEITDEEKSIISTAFSILGRAIAANNFEHGWRSPDAPPRNVGELTALLHSEVTECFESYRNNEPALWYKYPNYAPARFELDSEIKGQLGKPEGMASELADVIIRVFDMADELKIPVTEALLHKHAYNLTRPYKHGGKAC